jgi:hypothetical protein
MNGPDVSRHWHAYAWTGNEIPRDGDRRNPKLAYPPTVIGEWLLKPAEHVLATYDMPAGRLPAYTWLCGELERHPRGPRDVPAEVQLAHTVDLMSRCTDVVWGYWSAHSRYVSRALIVCPRDGDPCPY